MLVPNPNLLPQEIKRLTYRKYMFMYGIISVLLVRDYFESVENFEECSVIMEAIAEQEIRLDTKFPTVIDDSALNTVLKVYHEHGQTGVHLLENSQYYCTIILKEILENSQPL